MRTELVSLRHLRERPPVAVTLRSMCGSDEMAVDGVDTRAAVALLDRLRTSAGGVEAMELAAADRDALLAAVHRQCWGDRIVSTLVCTACAAPFDLSFELLAMQRTLAADAAPWRVANGRVTSMSTVASDTEAVPASFVVPNAAEELDELDELNDLNASGSNLRAAVERLAAGCGATSEQIGLASEALEAGAPLLDLELQAKCPGCGHEQLAHFDVQSFVLQRLLNERALLLAEIHMLATNYGWSLTEILALPRETRRALTGLLSDSLSRASRPRPGGWS